MHYLGLVLDYDPLRQGLKALHEGVVKAVEMLTTVTHESQYKGQREAWTPESMRMDLQWAAAQILPFAHVDTDALVESVETGFGIPDLNHFVRLTAAYREHGLPYDATAIFAGNNQNGTIDLVGLPAHVLLDRHQRQIAVGDHRLGASALLSFARNYLLDLNRLETSGLFSPGMMSIKRLVEEKMPVTTGTNKSVHYNIQHPDGRKTSSVFNIESKGTDAVDELIHGHARNAFLKLQAQAGMPIAPAMRAKPA